MFMICVPRRSAACQGRCSNSSIAAPRTSIAVANNRAAFERIKLRHRALVDVSGRAMNTTLFGKPVSMPMAIAPTGAAGLCWHEGELELAKAAAKAKIPVHAGDRRDDLDGEDRRQEAR